MIGSLLGDNLVAAALQAGILALAAAPLPRLLGVWSPRARLVLWRLVMVACVALPLLQPRVALEPASRAPALVQPEVVAADVGGSSDKAVATPPAGSVLPRFSLGGLIVAGALLRFAWLGLGLLALSRLRRRAVRLWPRTPAVNEAVEAVGTDAEFLVSPHALRPMTFGVWRPVVLVPSDFQGFPHDQQKAIACHELLHVRRFDWLRAAGDEIVRALAWFHPAAWWLTDQIHLSREQLVDQQVVRRLGSRRPYLDALLQLASTDRRGALLPASLFLGRAHLPQRVALLLKEVRMSPQRLALSFAAMAIVLACCGGAAIAAFPLHRPAVDVVLQPQPSGGAADVLRRVREVRPEFQPGLRGMEPLPWLFELTIDASGAVTSVKSLTPGSDPDAEAAIEAMRRWRYEPQPKAPRSVLVGFNLAAGRVDPPQPPVLVGGTVKAPKKTGDARPRYPKEAIDGGIQGVVILKVRIDSEGAVSQAEVIRSIPALDMTALDAVLRWRYEPAGFPIELVVTVNFTLASSRAAARGGVAGGVQVGVKGAVAGGVGEGVGGGVGSGVGGGVEGRVGGGVGAGTGGGTGAGMGAGARAGSATEYVRVGGETGIAPPVKVVDVRPLYPPAAKEQGIQGVVVIEVLIEPDGRVGHARVMRSVPGLDEAALDAVRQWQFMPTLKDGVPVGVVSTVTVSFLLK